MVKSMNSKLMVGNWKMNGSLAANASLLSEISSGLRETSCRVAVCVPAPYLAQAHNLLTGSAMALGAQDVSAHESGAYTGEVSANMLRDFTVRYAIVGHSERRQYHGETDAVVATKAQRALAAVIHANGHCISEIVVAYEPVWAIGTGLTATPEQAQQVHAVLRAQLQAATAHADRVSILYGGSMNAANAADLLLQPDVDGGLIGGAALKAPDFLSMLKTASR